MTDPWATLDAALDAVLAWLRIMVTPTVSTGEILFTPFIALALAIRLGNAVDMWRLRRRLRGDPRDADLAASAHERLRQAERGAVRLLCWGLICWALLVNWPYTQVAFTFGVLTYAVIEATDASLDWLYQRSRARYWQQKDMLDDYAEKVAETAATEARLARTEAQQARRAAEAAVSAAEQAREQALVLAAAVAKNIDLTIKAGERADAAYHEANTINEKIAGIGEDQERQADRTERIAADTNERLQQIVPRIVTPQERDESDPPGSLLTVGEQIERTHNLAEQALGEAREAQETAEGATDEGKAP